jgi:Surface lipoprotein assembly modifier
VFFGFGEATTGAGVERARRPLTLPARSAGSLSYHALRLGFGYHQEFKNGIAVDLQPEVFVTSYDAENPIFLARRRDQIVSARAILTDSRLEFGGALPYFSYTYTNDMSNLQFYSYQRHQIQLGLTFHF